MRCVISVFSGKLRLWLATALLASARRAATVAVNASRLVLVAGAVTVLAGCSHFVLLHDPLTASEHNDLGVAYERNGKPELAAKEYRKAIRLEPHASRTRVNLGNLEAANGRWDRAERNYRRALRDSTTNLDAMNNLAMALLRQRRRLDEARMLAERAVAGGGERDSVYRATLGEVRAAGR